MFRVLLAADGDTQRVRRQADAIAQLPNASESVEVYVLYVFDDSALNDDSEMVDPRRVNAVAEVAEYLSEEEIDAELIGRAGPIVETVLNVVAEHEVDAIYIGGASRSPTGKALFGSVTQDVILQSNVPVTVTIDR